MQVFPSLRLKDYVFQIIGANKNSRQNNNAEKLEIEKKRVRIEEQEANDKRDFNNKQIEVKEKQLQVEVAQIADGNPYNDKIHD